MAHQSSTKSKAIALTMAIGFAGFLKSQDPETQFRKSCMSCHTIGIGAKVGPDLKGLTSRRSRDWAMNFIQTPGSMIDRGDPIALQLLKEANNVKMPDLGITALEADTLIRLIEEYTKANKTLGSMGITRPVTPADIARGKLFFEGRMRFAKGAASCLSCHSAPGAGLLGGGRLGPDLTTTGARMGKGLASAIENPVFPTMQGHFKNRPLNPEEAFQVAAYLQSVTQFPPPRRDVIFPIAGFLGVVGGLSLGHRFGLKRFKGVRQNLQPRA